MTTLDDLPREHRPGSKMLDGKEKSREFVRLCGPVVYGFARKRGLQDDR